MSFNFQSGAVTVTTTAALALTIQPGQWVLLQNTGSSAILLGNSTVTTSGATIGYSLAAGTSVTLPAVGGESQNLFAIVATGTGTLVFLAPAN
jgi:hypothetical protein